jgi:opacity protein-like surface antigen
MKFSITFFCALIISTAAFSQQSGGYFLGGSFNFDNDIAKYEGESYNEDNDEYGNLNFGIFPAFGFQLNNHWEAGIRLNFSTDIRKRDYQNYERNINDYGIGIFGRYFINPDDKFKVFISPNAGFEISKRHLQTSITVNNEKIKNEHDETWYNAGLNLSIGATYHLNKRLRLLTYLGFLEYGYNFTEDDENDVKYSEHNFKFTGNLSNISLGIEYQF